METETDGPDEEEDLPDHAARPPTDEKHITKPRTSGRRSGRLMPGTPEFPKVSGLVCLGTLLLWFALREMVLPADMGSERNLFLYMTLLSAAFIVPAILAQRLCGKSIGQSWFPRSFAFRDIVFGIAAAIAFAMLMGLYTKLRILPGITHTTNTTTRMIYDVEWRMQLWLIGALCIVVPIGEEWFFRGILYPFMRKGMGPLHATLINAMLFAIIHGGNSRLMPLCLMALVSCTIYEYSRSLFAPILLHIGLNFGSVFFLMSGAHAAKATSTTVLWAGFFMMNIYMFMFGRGLYKRR